MSLPFRTLIEQEKRVAGLPIWSRPDGVDKDAHFTAALDIGERTMRGLELVGRAKIDQPTKNISFSLVYHPTANRRDAVPMARLDWRPHLIHTNGHKASPPGLYLLEIEGTHHHSFELNWLFSEGRPLKWLPVAEPIIPDFASFAELLDGVRRFFRIENASSVPEPEWAQELFDG